MINNNCMLLYAMSNMINILIGVIKIFKIMKLSKKKPFTSK